MMAITRGGARCREMGLYLLVPLLCGNFSQHYYNVPPRDHMRPLMSWCRSGFPGKRHKAFPDIVKDICDKDEIALLMIK